MYDAQQFPNNCLSLESSNQDLIGALVLEGLVVGNCK